ncbi:hypothetical protein BH24ACT11_BH24ACT11_16660 [soil metagenome]
MQRRVSLPLDSVDHGDAVVDTDEHQAPETARSIHSVATSNGEAAQAAPADAAAGKPRSSGRVRHDEKMTVYITADELFELETARLSLRRRHGVAVDRGRLVREALAIVLADLDDQGADSQLARRLAAS